MKNKRVTFLILSLSLFTPRIGHDMHIMEGFLPVKWAIMWGLLSIPFIILGIRSINKNIKGDTNKKVLLGLAGGFVFVLSALKIPSVTGSCSHPTGVGLGVILFGSTTMTVIGLILVFFQPVLCLYCGFTSLRAS